MLKVPKSGRCTHGTKQSGIRGTAAALCNSDINRLCLIQHLLGNFSICSSHIRYLWYTMRVCQRNSQDVLTGRYRPRPAVPAGDLPEPLAEGPALDVAEPEPLKAEP